MFRPELAETGNLGSKVNNGKRGRPKQYVTKRKRSRDSVENKTNTRINNATKDRATRWHRPLAVAGTPDQMQIP